MQCKVFPQQRNMRRNSMKNGHEMRIEYRGCSEMRSRNNEIGAQTRMRPPLEGPAAQENRNNNGHSETSHTALNIVNLRYSCM